MSQNIKQVQSLPVLTFCWVSGLREHRDDPVVTEDAPPGVDLHLNGWINLQQDFMTSMLNSTWTYIPHWLRMNTGGGGGESCNCSPEVESEKQEHQEKSGQSNCIEFLCTDMKKYVQCKKNGLPDWTLAKFDFLSLIVFQHIWACIEQNSLPLSFIWQGEK